HDVAGAVGAGHDLAAELLDLLDGVDRHVARSRDDAVRPLDLDAEVARHLLGDEDSAVAGGLGARLRAAPADALAGEDTRLVAVGHLLVRAEEIADLPGAHADVPGGDVRVPPQVPEELGHEGLAEAHDLAVGTTLGVEVG